MSKGYWISVYEKIEDPKILSEYAKKQQLQFKAIKEIFCVVVAKISV
jgi:hypothetical protein